MQFVVVLDVDEAVLDGDDSIENACRLVNQMDGSPEPHSVHVRPLSEIIAC